MPLPWDAHYLIRWSQFLLELSNHIDSGLGASRFAGIQITGAAKGVEMYLPNFGDDPQRLIDLGYTHQRLTSVYKYLIRAYAQAFPGGNKILSLSSTVINTGEQNRIHEDVVDYMRSRLPEGAVKISYWQDKTVTDISRATEALKHGYELGMPVVLEPASRNVTGDRALSEVGVEWAEQFKVGNGELIISPYEEQADLVLALALGE
jgi:hypothetical protein